MSNNRIYKLVESVVAQAGFKKVAKAAVSRKIKINTNEMNAGALHSGSKKGPLVKSRAQAIAISYSQARRGIK